MTSYKINGYTVENITVSEATKLVLSEKEKNISTLFTINTDHLAKLINKTNSQFNVAYASADIIVQDSRVLSKLVYFKQIRAEVCPGSDLTVSIFQQLSYRPLTSVLIVGGESGDIDKLRRCYSLENDIFWYNAPLNFLSDCVNVNNVIDCISEKKPDLIFLAIGCPQQEILANEIKNKCCFSARVLCVGASIDFIVGRQRRAPLIFQKLCLEWAFRFLSNPRRFFSRYLDSFFVLFRLEIDK